MCKKAHFGLNGMKIDEETILRTFRIKTASSFQAFTGWDISAGWLNTKPLICRASFLLVQSSQITTWPPEDCKSTWQKLYRKAASFLLVAAHYWGVLALIPRYTPRWRSSKVFLLVKFPSKLLNSFLIFQIPRKNLHRC